MDDSNTDAMKSKDYQSFSGYLKLMESIGPLKTAKKRWFVLEHGGRFLYYYHNDKDVVPVGRIYLPTAAFFFDPRQPHCFEIRSNGKVKSFEAPDRATCLKWLELLQNERHWCLEHCDKVHDANAEMVTRLPDLSKFLECTSHGPGGSGVTSSPAESEPCFSMHNKSVFYVTENGELKENSLKYPLEIDAQCDDVPEEGVEFSVGSRTSANGTGVPGSDKISSMFHRLLKLSLLSTQKQCPNCKQLITVASDLKEKCVDLQDELLAAQEMIEGLQESVKASQDQMDNMKLLLKNNGIEEDPLELFLKSQKEVEKLEAEKLAYKQQLENVASEMKRIEETLEDKLQEVAALQRAVLSKDEKIISLAEQRLGVDSGGVAVGRAIELDAGEYEIAVEPFLCSEVQVVDSSDQDLARLQDLVHGYETQNQFLNKEILELQNVIRHLEGSESRVSRRCFDVEAQFYQLKSRYLLLLNHFQPNKELTQQVAGELMKEAEQSLSLPNTQRKRFTDDLGFYLAPKCVVDGNQDLFLKAGELQKVSAELSSKKQQETDENYLNWLTRWDSFLVNFADKLLSPGPDLKELIRSGVPHTYRARVWKSLIVERTKDIMSEVGTGYFDCLCRINLAKSSEGYDPALKQIDLDLTRTLPNNIYFEDLQAEKIESLRRVLYSYRGHNPRVGYCQGLNRLAAVALLYLSEEDAFWALIAIVEHLQPRDYYSTTMLGARTDQFVLNDLLREKIPKLHTHLQNFEIDLSLFTFNWFLTIFVDSLPHQTYLNIWDCFLYEGNKVLFRFALAALRLNEEKILNCRTSSAVHSCLSKIGEELLDYRKLAEVAFRHLNPFSLKLIESKRQFYLSQLRT